MKNLEEIDKTELREMINKNWMTHDAMWFYHSLMECGIEKTNAINLNAVKSMAQIEARRLRKILGAAQIDSFDRFREFIEKGSNIVKGDFMKFSFTFPGGNVLRVEWEKGKCFAYEGIKKLGMIEQYKCGIFARMESWFDAFGLKYETDPEIKVCNMHLRGECAREYRFEFAKESPC